MTASLSGGALQLRITISFDESPELFRLASAIVEPKRRARRIKDLATKGMYLELFNGNTGQRLPTVASTTTAGPSVESLIDWVDPS
jgi:hypothetical protein